MYPGVRIFKIWGFDQISINIVENHRKLFSLWFYQIWTDILCLGSILSLFRGILTIFGHFRPFFNTAIYYDFTAISVLEIIAVFTAFYCFFQITEIYCDFSDSHCDFHPRIYSHLGVSIWRFPIFGVKGDQNYRTFVMYIENGFEDTLYRVYNRGKPFALIILFRWFTK